MLDMQYVRDNAEFVKKATKDKGFDESIIDELLAADIKHRSLIGEVEAIRRERNILNDSLKKNRTDDLIARSRKLKVDLDAKEPELEKTEVPLAVKTFLRPVKITGSRNLKVFKSSKAINL